MRILLFFLILISIFSSAKAEENISISELSVDIWPEFDRPAILIIYNLILSPETVLPANVIIHIPRQANLNAVAIDDPVSGLINAEYLLESFTDGQRLTIKATKRKIHIEYYEELIRDDSLRRITFNWESELPVFSFSTTFQKPVGAEYLTLDPAPASSRLDQYGLMTYTTSEVSLDSGQVFAFHATYQKSDDELSVSNLGVEPLVPLSDTDGKVALSDGLPWILGGLGLALLIIGSLAFFGFRGYSGNMKKIRTRDTRIMGGKESGKARILEPASCEACGQRAEESDRFCRSCGTRLG